MIENWNLDLTILDSKISLVRNYGVYLQGVSVNAITIDKAKFENCEIGILIEETEPYEPYTTIYHQREGSLKNLEILESKNTGIAFRNLCSKYEILDSKFSSSSGVDLVF